MIELAVEARVDYADLLSEPAQLQRRAPEEADLTGISGPGARPELSNVLVRHAADELDELQRSPHLLLGERSHRGAVPGTDIFPLITPSPAERS
jgi:saccharopine dehydrogenase-like NADP-dependent oxidoreductase